MKRFLMPLIVFAGLNVGLIILFLTMGDIGAAGDALATSTNGSSDNLWGWSWATGSVRFVVFAGAECGILWATAKAFFATRH